MLKFVEGIENRIKSGEVENVEDLNNHIKEVSKETLLKIYKKKVNENNEEEKLWFSEEINSLIEKRKIYNRLKRNEKDPVKQKQWLEKYEEFKMKGQIKIREEMFIYEEKMVKRLKENKGQPKVQWKYIDQLRNENDKIKMTFLYNKEGDRIDNEEETIKKVWSEIYNKKPNDIANKWNEAIRTDYKVKNNKVMLTKTDGFKKNITNGVITANIHRVNIPIELCEHYDAVFKIKQKPVNNMKETEFSNEEVKYQIKKTKNNKSR